ncbi:2-dehydro-3-deoxy-6-phosphogalactonate aldolase [Caulobacter sp.]|jgi:2-dehydro-3-deoxyphosphogalactonate aldolase|uniref:2-dehydro-3-deoxy-6-phosphogalactonate aldolase n=1 Tax=Caulobacter sp. TaxID=78 RepID=UPI0016152848
MTTWTSVLETLPLVAILRGLKPDEAVEVGEALVAAGFLCLEVPLNSPQPLDSIRRLRDALGDRAIVGAGTVLSPRAVQEVADAGGQIIISPNSDPAVIAATKAAGLISFPAFFTPTEAFAAIDAGADALKLFPAETAGPATLKAIKAVLPPAAPVFPVGGVEPGNLAAWRAAGANGFGLGSALYKPGHTAAQVGAAAQAFVAAWKATA